MESYGEILRKQREEKGYDFEEVSQKTCIPRNYIEALEKEDTDVFSSETYIVGFLKNYCDFLEIDSAKIISLFKAKKTQEQPVPTELLEKSTPKHLVLII